MASLINKLPKNRVIAGIGALLLGISVASCSSTPTKYETIKGRPLMSGEDAPDYCNNWFFNRVPIELRVGDGHFNANTVLIPTISLKDIISNYPAEDKCERVVGMLVGGQEVEVHGYHASGTTGGFYVTRITSGNQSIDL